MRFALCALRYFEVAMPAIAPIEDLRTAQKEGLSIYAMRYALCLPAVGTALCEGLHDLRFTPYDEKGEGGRDFRKAK